MKPLGGHVPEECAAIWDDESSGLSTGSLEMPGRGIGGLIVSNRIEYLDNLNNNNNNNNNHHHPHASRRPCAIAAQRYRRPSRAAAAPWLIVVSSRRHSGAAAFVSSLTADLRTYFRWLRR